VVQEEWKENHFYPIDYWDFLTGLRNSCYSRERETERNDTPRESFLDIEIRAGEKKFK